jgi:hypothetical protein
MAKHDSGWGVSGAAEYLGVCRYFKALIYLVLAGALFSCESKRVPPVGPDSHIEISITGGGFYGGINPTTENRLTVHSDGRVIVSHGSLYGGASEKSYTAPRDQVLELAGEIAALGFFSMDELYDCKAGHKKCELRKTNYPPAVPIEVEVRIDNDHHRVKVTVFDNSMVRYPEELDQIVVKVRELAKDHD